MSSLHKPFALAASIFAVLSFPEAQAQEAGREIFAPVYTCETFGADGKVFDKFDVTIQPRKNGEFEYEVEILSTVNGSGKLPTTAKALISGGFEVVSRSMGPNGAPPNAFSPRTGVKLVFEGLHPSNNGYAIVYKDGVSWNFESAGFHPVAAGICSPTPETRDSR